MLFVRILGVALRGPLSMFLFDRFFLSLTDIYGNSVIPIQYTYLKLFFFYDPYNQTTISCNIYFEVNV